jgi:nucleotide-binding universal stress UspA family protein
MPESILVPLDGSAFAEQAIPAALGIARRSGARLELALVREPPLPVVRGPGAPVRDARLDQELREADLVYLESVAERLGPEAGGRIGTAFLEGAVVETLERHIGDTAPDLVVMTTHARGGLSRAWLGSVADRLVRRSAAPVLLIRPSESRVPSGPGARFVRVLIPLDGTEAGEAIIEHAIDAAGSEGVEYTLLRVVSAGPLYRPAAWRRRDETPSSRAQRATVEATLSTTADALRARGLTVSVRVPVNDDAAQGILQYADESGADLIAMVTRTRGGLERLVLGSVADKVLRSATCPVLLLNPLTAAGKAGRGSAAAAARFRESGRPRPQRGGTRSGG